MGERVDRTHEVRGSNPLTSTRMPFCNPSKINKITLKPLDLQGFPVFQ